MTIDEAIKYELSGGVIPPTEYIQTYREQVAKWLEELKAIREYIKPLRNTNTHNEYLERLKELVK